MRAAAGAFAPHVTLDLTATNPTICADRYHLEAALNNLIDNAIKYSPAPPHVVLHTRQLSSRLVWSVQDSGIGIAPAHQKAVFRQFFRLPSNPGNPVGGFGLGLYYVGQVARAHDWRLTLDSEPGRGSTFIISERVKERSSSFRSFTSDKRPYSVR